MSAFPKADVQNIRIGTELNVRFWPKAAIRTESKSVFLNVRFGEKSRHSSTVNVCVSPESASGNFSAERGTVLLNQLTEILRGMSLPVERGL